MMDVWERLVTGVEDPSDREEECASCKRVLSEGEGDAGVAMVQEEPTKGLPYGNPMVRSDHVADSTLSRGCCGGFSSQQMIFDNASIQLITSSSGLERSDDGRMG